MHIGVVSGVNVAYIPLHGVTVSAHGGQLRKSNSLLFDTSVHRSVSHRHPTVHRSQRPSTSLRTSIDVTGGSAGEFQFHIRTPGGVGGSQDHRCSADRIVRIVRKGISLALHEELPKLTSTVSLSDPKQETAGVYEVFFGIET